MRLGICFAHVPRLGWFRTSIAAPEGRRDVKSQAVGDETAIAFGHLFAERAYFEDLCDHQQYCATCLARRLAFCFSLLS